LATLKYHPPSRRNLNRPVVRGSGVRNRLLTALASHVLCAASMDIETRVTLDLQDTLVIRPAPWDPHNLAQGFFIFRTPPTGTCLSPC
ncbi:MAG: hypothetical protein P8N60_10310, partial [Burkholderiaceae bacterium]|nr:hypothetical protein [Burkholderiaceae bacterium]